jgi:SPP1 family predicted phage head-tail adaptor
MNTGRLNKRVVIEKPTDGDADAYGEKAVTWSTLATVWAGVMPQGTREFYRAQQVHPEISQLLTIRYRDDVTPAMRVRFGSRYLYIEGVTNIDEANHEMQLICTEPKA